MMACEIKHGIATIDEAVAYCTKQFGGYSDLAVMRRLAQLVEGRGARIDILEQRVTELQDIIVGYGKFSKER